METLLQKILELLIKPEGSLIFHLVLVFAVISSLQAATIGRPKGETGVARRMILGLSMLLVGQVVLFLSSGLAWQGILDPQFILPPLDRAVFVFSLVWIVWLWNFPKPARLGDLVTGFLNLGVILLFLFTYSSWIAQPAGSAFTGSLMDLVWELSALFIVLTGMAILVFSRPAGWGFGLGMLSLLLAGTVAHLLLHPVSSSLSPYIRLGMLASFPLLPTLLHRFETTTLASSGMQTGALPASEVPPRAQERRRYSSSPRTVNAWLKILETREPENVVTGMAKALSHTMLSDLCLIVNGLSYGHVVFQGGYDLIREEEIKGTLLEQGKLPSLANAVQRGKPLRITSSDSQPADMKMLSDALGLNEVGSLLFVPLAVDEKPLGGILFLSPYSNRQWSIEDQDYLSSEYELIARILKQAQQVQLKQQNSEKVAEERSAEIENLRRENQKMHAELNDLRQGGNHTAPKPVPVNEISALVALQEEAQNQITNLQSENERLQAALRERGISVLSPEEFERVEVDLRATLQEIAQLQNQLAEANARNLILEREAHLNGKGNLEEREVVASVVQDIRQPMSSILGYTDLLLSESVGILGALQRKFLERIKASTERMHTMLDNLIQVATIDEEKLGILPQPVELSAIIDAAVADVSSQLRDKNIALAVDLPQEMPAIHADRDAIQQIILHLLQNAGDATPAEGTVTLRARVQAENEQDYLLLQVTDTGGGVQPEDLPRVFSRRYRAEMPLIQGIGDTGVGLSIARTLVEAHNGRIWVDSLPGESTSFSVLLPIQSNSNGS